MNKAQRLAIPRLTINSRDPTRTTTIRNGYARALAARFRELIKKIKEAILREDILGLNPSPLGTNQGPKFPGFTTDADRINKFMAWLEGQIAEEILIGTQAGGTGAAIPRNDPTISLYIQRVYREAVDQSTAAMIKLKIIDAGEAVSAAGEFGALGVSGPIHANALATLYTRNFRGLKKITDEMAGDIARALAEGLSQGLGPDAVARLIVKSVNDIGITRAKLLARTEIINAHAEATLNRFEQFGVLEVVPYAEFSTAGDNKVCARCLALEAQDNGKGPGVFTIEQARGIIPVHPRCRCVWIPVTSSLLANWRKIPDSPRFRRIYPPPGGYVTRRELQVLKLLELGYSNQQIADDLAISVNTAKKHAANIYKKLDVSNRIKAVAEARRRKILLK